MGVSPIVSFPFIWVFFFHFRDQGYFQTVERLFSEIPGPPKHVEKILFWRRWFRSWLKDGTWIFELSNLLSLEKVAYHFKGSKRYSSSHNSWFTGIFTEKYTHLSSEPFLGGGNSSFYVVFTGISRKNSFLSFLFLGALKIPLNHDFHGRKGYPSTSRIIPWLGSVVNNHGYLGPLRIGGCCTPLPNELFMAYTPPKNWHVDPKKGFFFQ